MSLPSTTWTLLDETVPASAAGAARSFTGVDLLLDGEGDIVVGGDLQLVEGAAAAAQSIGRRLLFFRGEWFVDLGFGVPYFEEMFDVKYDPARARAAFREAIEDAPLTDEMLSLSLNLDAARALRVAWQVRTTAGSTIAGTTETEV